ncbi:DsbA family protein [Sphingomonas melonis]|uniref:Protein-disulfide isomerase n=1 Tax=Sphingomonas melonis TaxID=152682 RepID=A0A7Y9FPC9_9SPHN|nr:DsbA family protein [Sphingomonas melonis]NYD90592.1 protein-disulfide isomerase [Sphingomonas melonis]
MSRFTLPLTALLGGLIGAGLVWSAEHVVSPGGTDQARIERVVHDYVLAHPEIIPQAMQALQERQSGETVAANRDAIVTPFGSAWAGNPKGDVTLVEYFDYNCGYCRASLPMIADLLKRDPNLRIVYRDLPILSDESRVAARASLAAAQQGKFLGFHDALYAGGPVSDASIKAAAAKAGVTLAALDTNTIDAEIAKNMQTAAKLGMNGTPSWVVGNRVLSGALPVEELEKAIAAARGK